MPLSLPGGIIVIHYLQASMLLYFLQGFEFLQNCGSEMPRFITHITGKAPLTSSAAQN